MRSALRILRILSLAVIAIMLLLLAFIQQHRLRYRAEQLLADFQSIRLHQSTWADAQNLMTRWGAWGHYDGECTSSDCAYTITLSDAVSEISRHVKSDRGWWRSGILYRTYEMLGGKDAELKQVTSYDLSCLTRLHPCVAPLDVLPIDREWEADHSLSGSDDSTKQCGIPTYVRARDANYVLIVDVLSSTMRRPEQNINPPGDVVVVTGLRVTEPLKGTYKKDEVLSANRGTLP